ncbi:MAG: HEAT repeat domain-containing protein [Minicystis sp.]
MSEISDLALQHEKIAIVKARAAGPAALPELFSLARHTDGEVREIALYGLDEIGDRRASPTFVEALLDPEPMVRGVAMRALHKRPDPAVYPQLLDTYDQSPEPVVRHNVALILGRLGAPPVDLDELGKRYQAEADPFAQEGLVVALAKLGDESARDRFVELLHASRGRDRLRFLEHGDYLADRWLLRPLLPLLDDPTPLRWVGADGRPGPEQLRACDMVVNLVARISGWGFSFTIGGRINYTPGDLAEVRHFLEAIPRGGD